MESEKALPHALHVQGLSLLCTQRCAVSAPDNAKALPHVSNVAGVGVVARVHPKARRVRCTERVILPYVF